VQLGSLGSSAAIAAGPKAKLVVTAAARAIAPVAKNLRMSLNRLLDGTESAMLAGIGKGRSILPRTGSRTRK